MTSPRLKGMTWDHPRGYQGLEAASQLYEQQTGISIEWDRRSLQAFADASIEKLASDYDFIILDHPHVGLIADSECLLPLPLPDDHQASSLGGSLESYLWKDQLWAYPVDAACQVAVQRPDLSPDQLPNWEAVLDGKDVPRSIVTPLLPVDAFDMMMTLIAGRGEEKLAVNEREFCTNDNGLLSLKILKALFKAGPEEAVGWNPIHVLEAMANNNDFAYSPCLFGYINYARPGYREHQLGYVDLPSFRGTDVKRGILGGAGIGVSSKTAHAGAAISFAKWVQSEPVQSGIYLENEGQPAHRQSWLKMGSHPDYQGFLQGARHTIDNAWTRPRDVWFLSFVDDVCEIFPSFFTQDRNEEAFLAELNALYRHHKI